MAIDSAPTGQLSRSVHIGRQPIHDLDGRIHAYELLFRNTDQALEAAVDDGDHATTTTILAAFSDFAVDDLLGGLPGFVNLTRAFLVGQLPVPFDPGQAVLEVLETVQLDEDVVAGVRALREQGYEIALDDFVYSEAAEDLVQIASIVKIDVLGQTWDEVMATVERCRRPGVRLLAERVEDAAMMQRCREVGFTLFQGYHLGRPQTLTTGSISPSHLLAVQLLAKLSKPDVSVREIDTIMRSDPGLVLRLLRLANGAANGLTRSLSSITDAVVLIGLEKLRAWMVLISLSDAHDAGTDTSVALTRAHTCELLTRRLVEAEAGSVPAPRSVYGGSARPEPEMAFTLGLLDGIAFTLGVTPAILLEGLPPLAPRLQAAMDGAPGRLRTVLDAVLAYEAGAVNRLGELGIRTADVASCYLAALAWTNQVTAALRTP